MSDHDIDPTSPRMAPKPEVTKIDGRELKPSTLMMGYGYDPVLSEGSLKPPIFLTSTFAFPSAADGKRHFEGITGKRPGGADGLVYSRFNAPNQEILEDRLAVWDGAEDALSFSSGMTAICVLMLAYASKGDVIVHSGPLYAASEGFVAKWMSRWGVEYVDFPAGATREEIDAVLARAKDLASQNGGKVCMIYLESPGNPTNALVDVEAVKAARDEALDWDCPIAIDNTFLGPLWQRPLDQGADIVCYSLTKYVGGHSDLVAGSIAGAKKWMDPVRMLRNTMGGICDPNTAWMLLRSLETVELRMNRAGENAAKVCQFLAQHPKVEGLGYLGMIKDARQQDIYDRHCKGAGSTFSLLLKGGEAECFRFLDSLKIAKLAVSLGGTETLASHPASMTHLSVPEGRRAELGISDNLVRISIGIEDPDDLIADFEQALEAV
ncbi:cystathionine gamma-synthase family protein [Erythrobacter sp. SN021]|uniref:cystathionine gamma-synthase family protein n=1 Tax=Erythrobacter sp. SN021 TaxID=2912574 RepID=UPI000C4CB6FB|nr:cystathionine gamma-synthase family protein [Erythrobacter sp. SN021]MBL45288.1 methionine gamma-lyase [Sphingomonadaceae bacterium]MCF8883752.1 cystathionine gamma-synthase family protein [Erythrobacter sp. SN021]